MRVFFLFFNKMEQMVEVMHTPETLIRRDSSGPAVPWYSGRKVKKTVKSYGVRGISLFVVMLLDVVLVHGFYDTMDDEGSMTVMAALMIPYVKRDDVFETILYKSAILAYMFLTH